MIEFMWALLAIIVIDVVLGGENAIVIGMTAAKLPEEQQNKVIFWGTFGAVAVRFISVAALTYLLMIPGLRLAGGLILVYIAWELLQEQDNHHNIKQATTLSGAISTIVIADAAMGLDNALAIAGAANGNWTLIIIGLLISVPIVLYGSTIVSKLLIKYPKIVYVGSFVLLAVAAQMVYSEPIINSYIKGFIS